MKTVKITMEVELPNDYDEKEIDAELSETIFSLGGEILDINRYK